MAVEQVHQIICSFTQDGSTEEFVVRKGVVQIDGAKLFLRATDFRTADGALIAHRVWNASQTITLEARSGDSVVASLVLRLPFAQRVEAVGRAR